MNLTEYLKKRLTQRKILLMTHAVVGYPSLEANWEMLEMMAEADVDLVELQMPFSEPSADGPLFVKANQEALRNGIRWVDYFDLMQRASEQFAFPILMMNYCNTAFSMGYETYCDNINRNGAVGFIIPDLPLEEYGDLFESCRKQELNPIMICTPTNTKERLQKICASGSGFIYCAARKGVTGQNTELNLAAGNILQQCRQFTDLPLALGFGLSEPDDLRKLQGKAEIAIVGSALLKTWESAGKAAYRKHLMSLAEARI
ncbi:MAG: tryptophan synthase subunit alpha [SAR324 cluster bacterium]|nr:tryptophan synthase subunit alpha [SAR324 cluster bacterium]MBL7034934.1 tryptophan synthase subunit alpha [SAR324 cluster bacterium]